MGKHWARQQVRRDELQDALEIGVVWVSKNRQLAAAIAGGLAAALLIAGLLFYRAKTTKEAAWEHLAMIHALAYTNQVDSALQEVQKLEQESPSTDAAGYAQLFAGDILYPRGRYKEAADFYGKLADSGQPAVLMPFALSDLAITDEAAGQPAQAAQAAQRFLDAYADHFLAPQVHAVLARSLQAQGQVDAAKAALQKIVIQYPDTSFAAWAQDQLKAK